ncbi:hypothetical protein J8J14_18320 [Roseomonas sp. SSH11]|uniref:Uncharacterized protein n=1 Tax=Pararoseomonas baculiformis TaxID=2820812 RepID=A0ABS4AIP6_9PROT|nr:hypothetical protein [Pararoseomonas baculiformis]MBP0446734.1 hypothetical protein [Pararoseomonas baculiformis]
MPFMASSLIPLVAADSFTLWLYRTTDTRAAVLSPGYFGAAADRLRAGHMLLLGAADAAAILPVRSGAEVGNGLVLDAASSPLRLAATGSLGFSADLSASAVARCVSLLAMPSGVNEGESFTVQAMAAGATSAVLFSVLDRGGTVILGPATAPVTAGLASASFGAPPPGTGYRVKVEDAADPLVAQISPSFVVLSAFALLMESGLSLLAESGQRLVL